uniref:60S ribosomal protein L18-2 n=1 Tax=Rhizophora mucronata TaxID=61149 RepID=A0A2P2N2D8_RHIMU
MALRLGSEGDAPLSVVAAACWRWREL